MTNSKTLPTPGRARFKAVFLGLAITAMMLSGVALAAVPQIPSPAAATDAAHWDKVVVSWANVSNENYYELYRCTTNAVASCTALIATPDAEVTEHDDFNADATGGQEYYRVKACNNEGCSDFTSAAMGNRPTVRIVDWNTQEFYFTTGDWPEPDNLTASFEQRSDEILALKINTNTAEQVRAVAGRFRTQEGLFRDGIEHSYSLTTVPGDMGSVSVPSECRFRVTTQGSFYWKIEGKDLSSISPLARDEYEAGCELMDPPGGQTYYLNVWWDLGCENGNDICKHRLQSNYKSQESFSELVNISTRANVGIDDKLAIAGFIVEHDGQTCVVVKGRAQSVPVSIDKLNDPNIVMVNQATGQIAKLKNSEGLYVRADGTTTTNVNLAENAINDDWEEGPTAGLILQKGFGNDLVPSDAALHTCVDPGAYTVLLRGDNTLYEQDPTTYQPDLGTAIIEVFHASTDYARLYNISTRANVGTRGNGTLTIGGFILTGESARRILIRGRGPSLPVQNATLLSNPRLTLFRNQDVIAENLDWGTGANSDRDDILATGEAPFDERESAILMTLSPGSYTAWLEGEDGGEGLGIVEVYDVDAKP